MDIPFFVYAVAYCPSNDRPHEHLGGLRNMVFSTQYDPASDLTLDHHRWKIQDQFIDQGVQTGIDLVFLLKEAVLIDLAMSRGSTS